MTAIDASFCAPLPRFMRQLRVHGIFCILLPLILIVCNSAFGHHSRAAFDLDKTISVLGIVEEVSWTNPHYYFSVRSVGPEPQLWTFEGHSIPGLSRNGWTKQTLKVGQTVQVIANPNRKANKNFALIDHVVREDGQIYYAFKRPRLGHGKSSDAATNGIGERLEVGGSHDFSGTWRLIRTLQKNLVGGVFAPPQDWPLTPLAQAEVARFKLADDPSNQCQPRGFPRMLEWPYAQRWRITEEGIDIQIEHSEEHRQIPWQSSVGAAAYAANTNGRLSSVEVLNAANRQPVSQARLSDKNVLVIETSGFVEKFWGNARGISSSEEKTLREHYQFVDGGRRMVLTYMLSDPRYLTESVEVVLNYAQVHDYQFADEPPCDIATATRHLKYE